MEDDCVAVRAVLLNLYPDWRTMYGENDGNTQMLCFQNVTAIFSFVSGASETIAL